MSLYTARHEDITGADLTGAGPTNRTYVLANNNAILAQLTIILAENALQNNVNFTLDTATNTITFVTAVFDSQVITLDYLTKPAVQEIGDYYCTTLQITRAAGIGVEIFTENLGTGNNSTTSFDLDNGNVLDDSFTVKHGVADSNAFTNLAIDTDYTIQLDQGLIELTTAGKTALGTDVLYIDYVYSPRHSNSLLTTFLPSIVREVDKITGNYWGEPKTSFQYFDGYTSGYPQTDEPYGEQIDAYPEYSLKYKGLNSITSVLTLDRKGDTDRTLDADEYRILTEDQNNDYQESRILINTTIPNGKGNVKITFIHGYATIPELIQQIASYVGGLMALVNISGGSYKDVSTYSIGRKSFSIGQIYVNVNSSVNQMKGRIDSLVLDMGGNFDCA